MQLFVSDLHLGAESPHATAQFLGFLQSIAARAQALYILGDLFEVWIGDDDPDPELARVCEALAALSARGVPCFVLHGNRDFLLGEQFCRRTGCQLLPDPVLTELGGERVLLTHGDALCVDDHAYQELRSIVRSPRWQRRFLALPARQRMQLASQARAGSRAHTARTIPYVMDVNAEAVLAAFRATGARRIIHGHTHRPGRHPQMLEGRPIERIVLGAWYEQGSYLSWRAGEYQLCELSSEAAVPRPGPDADPNDRAGGAPSGAGTS
ncbi:MAG TPA: UDP-2,3-diacylglucosamine diphosphatase [Steroidobacteraceae bacterium]|nr:UDP-2,3-diacylglucosamine diphosphatase [Steroidobacteraceae bacterium]